MHYPSLAEYCDALQLNLGIALSDPLLGHGTLRSRGPGQPVVRSGNFALTFEVVVDGRSYAVRCFHKPSDSLQARYVAIGSYLRRIRSTCFVDFEFQPSGITTESGTYPIVRMDWAYGQTLAAFVAAHRADADALQQLRMTLRGISRELLRHGIAHGDIQPTNVIVQSPTEVRLIDYDGMFVPRLAGLQSTELGQRNFQHSGRRGRHFDASLDAFAFSLLDLTLHALCRRPELWEQSDSDADAFILRATDIADPGSSPPFSLLASMPEIEQRVRHFAAICAAPFAQVPTFEDFLEGRNIPTRPVAFTGSAALPLHREYVPACDVVDATNFAQCCGHVGDRVEMIGKVVRVALDSSPHTDTPCLRVEFANQSHDMACLKIWPEALDNGRNVPDATWAGQWVRAIGLVEPVHSALSGSGHHKDVAISITDSSQLHRIAAAEARRCLLGRRSRTRPALDTTASVKTDPVLTDATPRPLLEPTPVLAALPLPSVPADGRRSEADRTRPAPRTPARGQAERILDRAPPPPAIVPSPASPVAPLRPTPAPKPAPMPVPRPTAGRTTDSGRHGWRRWPWAAAALLGALAVYAVIDRRQPPTPDPPMVRAEVTREPVPATPATVSPAAPAVASRLEAQQTLDKSQLPLATLAGVLDIGPVDESDARPVILLDGQVVPGLRDDTISVVHRAVFADREVVVGFTRCDGTTMPCGRQRPFWLELRAGLPPDVRRVPGLWVGSGNGAGAVAASTNGVQIDLGLWNGERRSAALTTAGDILVARKREPRGSLSRADCATVIQAAESCATSRDCRSFNSSARPIPSLRWRRLTDLYHETTGLNAASFRALCVRSCELGLTPSDNFIRQRVCSGAPPDQWPPDDPAAGL
ncbi:MAG: hypothetical protein V9E93_19100 [Steroidobacteraceae bacterium]|nr:hypothetical protein [Pseudomonadota bacterium]MBP6107929.1 hypothetical protein [Steroidobacteraceae bacterium]MBP7012994.1 hypothetical protein [Steroidobacteraceae bacterium]